jgi:hypothetical protein
MRRNRLAGLALIAGLAGGGVTGALFGGPGISGAQEATTSTTAPANDAAPGPEGRGPGGPGCIGGHRGAGLDAAATALGMTREELRAELDEDTTIADVAEARNVDVQKVIDAMVADAKAHLAEKVAEGRLTQAEADAKAATLTERITQLVNEGKPARGDRPAPPAA